MATHKNTTTSSTSRRAPASSSATTAAPGHDAIAQRAYQLFVESGYQHGNELAHWLAAEAELRGSARSVRRA
jgi:hypothetical protein